MKPEKVWVCCEAFELLWLFLSHLRNCLPQLVENCVCLLRNLSYQVHREIPHAERYQEAPISAANNTGPHAASCFGAKKGKGM